MPARHGNRYILPAPVAASSTRFVTARLSATPVARRIAGMTGSATGRRGQIGVAMALAMLLVACGGAPSRPPRTAPHGSNSPVRPSDGETAQCFADLNRMGVRFSILPDRDMGGGCSIIGAVQLVDIGVPATGLSAMRCGTARGFAGWVRSAAAPAAYQILGSELAQVNTMGTYACRRGRGSAAAAAKLSGHAIANAVDVGGFTLKDGRRITLANDWNSPDPQIRRFLKVLHDSACRRFGTVLSPDYNAAHHDHFHLEADRAHFCR
jgi:hypothetical protein